MAEQNEQKRPYLGQRCCVGGKSFGTIVALQLDEQGKPWARVELDGQASHWFRFDDIEPLATYPAG